jgi:tRNA-splicing ligase RtcB
MNINTNKPYTIFAEVLEPEAVLQFESALQQPFTVKGALMPDAHTGYSLPIGAVVATDGVILPSWVGYDIGCGMCAVPTTFNLNDVHANASSIFNNIYKNVPVGFSLYQHDVSWPDGSGISRSIDTGTIFLKNGLKQLGTLGGGNHFIEVGFDDTKKVWIIIHSGSRGFGHAVASLYMKKASGDGKAREGHFGFDVNSIDGKNYIVDLNFCLEFALQNRRMIVDRVEQAIAEFISGEVVREDLINRNHNHAELKDGLWIHRKGATHADAGMMGVIPGNMRDGSFIVRGKGNPESLCSSSHGAGRVLGRKKAKETLRLKDFVETMVDITANVNTDTLDESPFAYKNIFDVMRLQEDLTEPVARVRPVINIKG